MSDDLIERLNDPHRRLTVSDRQEAAVELARLSALWIAETRENERLRALSPPEPTEDAVEKLFEGLDDRLDRLLVNDTDSSRFILSGVSAHNITEIAKEWVRSRLRAMPLQDHGWQPIPAPNDSAFRWYGLHVQHSGGYSWFEAHYVAHVDGQMLHPSSDNFDDWAFTDFEFWCDAPPIPAMVAEDGTP